MRVGALAGLCLVSVFLVGCDPGTDYRFRNATDVVVDVRMDGEVLHSGLRPGDSWVFTTIDPEVDFPTLVEAATSDGQLVFSREFSFQAACEQDFDFEIVRENPVGSVATAQAMSCDGVPASTAGLVR